jgi:hypothetical protein
MAFPLRQCLPLLIQERVPVINSVYLAGLVVHHLTGNHLGDA